MTDVPTVVSYMLAIMTFISFMIVGLYLRTRTILRYEYVGDDSAYYKLLLKNKQELIVVRKTNEINMPPLFWELTKFLHKKLKNHEKLFDLAYPMIDMLTGIILFLFALMILDGNIYLGLAVFGLYMVYPQITYQMSIVTTRQLGHLFFLLTMIFLYFSLHYPETLKKITVISIQSLVISYGFIALSAVCYSLTLLSHRMSTQMLWIVLFTMIFFYPFHVLFVVIIGTILAILLSKGFYLRVFKGHIIIIHFFMTQIKRLYQRHLKDFIKASPSYIIGFLASIVTIIVVENHLFLKIWSLSVLLSAFWWIWGDSERHFIYLVVPSLILLAELLSMLTYEVATVIWLVLFMYSLILSLKYKPTHLNHQLLDVCKKIKSLPEKSVIFAFGYGRLLALCSNKPFILTNSGGNTEEIWYAKKELHDLDLKEIVKKYHVTYFVVNTDKESWDVIPAKEFLATM